MKRVLLASLYVLFISGVVSADTFGTGDNRFTIDFVTISGDASSANGRYISGSSPGINHYKVFNDPANDYRIGTYEVTNGQFAKFAANNPNFASADVSATNVSWFEAAQFANYLNTSTGHQAAYKFSGSTMSAWDVLDTGYDASNPFRNSNSKYFLPTEDEWVKAAYWNGTSLQTFAKKNNTNPSEWSSTGGPNSDGQAAGWNFGYAYPDNSSSTDQPWDVTAGYSPEELNGTFDMMGNVWEWMESPHFSGDYLSGSDRGIRGGSYCNFGSVLSSSYQKNINPSAEFYDLGFRVASIVPEPCSLVLLTLGGLMLRRPKA